MSLAVAGVALAPALIGAAGAAGASAIASGASKNAAGVAGQAPQVNIAQLQQQAQAIAQQNAAASQALQNQYTPWITSGQSQSNTSLQNQLTPNAGTTASANYLTNNFANPLNSNLINQAAGVAGQQLNLGGALDQGTQNSVTRAGLAQAGTATPGGLGQGADVTARDLGLTSLQLQNQRLQNASQLGGQQLGASQASANNTLSQIGALQGITQNQFGNALNSAAMYNNVQAPTSGLNPGSLGGLAVGNLNAQQAANQSAAGFNYLGGMQTAGLVNNLANNKGVQGLLTAGAGSLLGSNTPSTINPSPQFTGNTATNLAPVNLLYP